MPAEQNPAKKQQPEGLPEANLPPPEQSRHQPIPKLLHDFAANNDECKNTKNCQRP